MNASTKESISNASAVVENGEGNTDHSNGSASNGGKVSWDEIAAGYSRHVTPTHFWLGEEALRRAGLKAGMKFLDIAAGSGALSIPAAHQGADVLAIDLSPGMLEYLELRASNEGLRNIETRVMDGHDLALASESYDLVGSQFGIMLFPEFDRAMREAVRVARPGSRVFVTVYGPPEDIDFLDVFFQGMQDVQPGFTGMPDDPPPHEFQAADPRVLAQKFQDAGLHDVHVETVTERLQFSSGRDFWDWIISSNPIAGMLTSDLSAAQLEALIEAFDSQIRSRAGSDGVAVLTNPCHIGIGTV